MIAHGAKHPGLQISKGHVVGKAASVDLGVVVTVRIAAVDEHAGRMRGGADDYHSSGLFWGDAGVDAKLSFARLSSLARGNWGSRGRRRFRV